MTQKGGKLVYQDNTIDFRYPHNAGPSTTEISENAFRREFIRALSRHLAKAFYDYELREDFAYDSTFVAR